MNAHNYTEWALYAQTRDIQSANCAHVLQTFWPNYRPSSTMALHWARKDSDSTQRQCAISMV